MPLRIEPLLKQRAKLVGIQFTTEQRSGSFLQSDQAVQLAQSWTEGLEIMGLRQALQRYDWLHHYLWQALKPDEYARLVETEFEGYFIRALPHCRIEIPVEACLYLRSVQIQRVHNIIIAEPGSELNLIAGCTFHPGAVGMHIGVSEFFVKQNATISFTMIHHWDPNIEVRPRSAAVVEKGGTFISNYVLLSPVKLLQMYPRVVLEGGAKAVFSNVMLAFPNSSLDVGTEVSMEGEGSSAEMISRVVGQGGNAVLRGKMAGKAACRGHLECRGLMLSTVGSIHAIPELQALHPEAMLSHEAAIGKIAEEEIFYLMTRGLNKEEAIATIVRGFLRVEVKGLSELLQREIEKVVAKVSEGL